MSWADAIPDEQWSIYRAALDAARRRNVRFALGGAFALAHYTGRWRDTKDLDLYIDPRDRETIIDAFTSAGLADYYESLPYDRAWIYRSFRDGVIVDAIWAMANQRASVDDLWLTRGPEALIRGERVRILPPEELLWAKLYIIQRDRCDWPDLLNLLYYMGPKLDWNHLMRRAGPDAPLINGLLTIFRWLCPESAQQLPAVLQTVEAPPGAMHQGCVPERVRWLDSRPWFAPSVAERMREGRD